MDKLIGREEEQRTLDRYLHSGRSELVVVYGRRRIGKTFLVRQYFKNRFTFSYVGRHNLSRQEQLACFAQALAEQSGSPYTPTLSSWWEAFSQLEHFIERLPKKQRKVIFIDEIPWMDSPKSDFVSALETFWNAWADHRDDILFIACGSATSWIVKKIFKNRGGLYNRVTCRLYLRPFCLAEVEEYLRSRRFVWDRFQIAQCYMAVGGIPFYLSLLDPAESMVQNIDRLFFASANAPMRTEFGELFATLFSHHENYVKVVRLLAERREGFTRTEISDNTGLGGSSLTTILDELERCDFIMGYQKWGSKTKGIIYRLTDAYTLFYYKFVDGDRSHDPQRWQHLVGKPQVTAWQGFSFELLCLLHLQQVKTALGIAGMATSASVWRSQNKDVRSQIDLVIDRADRIINLCEMKFSTQQYGITKGYEDHLRLRMSLFAAESRTRKGLAVTMVTTFGLLPSRHNGIVNSEVTLDALFVKP